MNFDDIMKIDDVEEKENLLIEYYTNHLKIEDWMNIDKKVKIKFKDRIEYKLNGEYHNILGPAIDFNDDQKDQYYIRGERIEKLDWTSTVKNIKRKIILKKINNERPV